MAALPKEDRQNVMLLAEDGNIYANKPWLKSVTCAPQNIGGNLYQDPAGNQFTLPDATPKPGTELASAQQRLSTDGHLLNPHVFQGDPYGGTGPYRRIFSKVPTLYGPDGYRASDDGPGYTYEDAMVTLPSNDPKKSLTIVRSDLHERSSFATTNDTACVYMGGWSAGYIDNANNYQPAFAADGGFQHDNGSNINNAAHNPKRDSWAMYLAEKSPLFQDRAYENGSNIVLAYGIRFYPTNIPVPMTFFITHLANGHTYLNLKVVAHAKREDNGQDIPGNQSYVMSLDVTHTELSTPQDPWHINGKGVVLKRMTTIAQNKPQNLYDCSYIYNVKWSQCRIGISGNAASVANWDTLNTAPPENYPVTGNKIRITNFTPSNPDYTQEIDAITLCGKK